MELQHKSEETKKDIFSEEMYYDDWNKKKIRAQVG